MSMLAQAAARSIRPRGPRQRCTHMTTNLVLRASLLCATAHTTFLFLQYQIAFAQAEQSFGDTSPAAARAGTSTESASADTTSDDLTSIGSIIVTDAASYNAGRHGTASSIRIKQEDLPFFGKTDLEKHQTPAGCKRQKRQSPRDHFARHGQRLHPDPTDGNARPTALPWTRCNLT